MARKHLLQGLMAPKLPAGNSEPVPATDEAPGTEQAARPTPRGARGAIGAVSRSIEGLKSAASEADQMRAKLAAGQAVVDLDPDLLDPSPVVDRILDESAGSSELVALIRDSGQQVPILARPHPVTPGRFQIAYGHRRARAAKELGRAVRAVVRQLSDAELVIAQGQENSARRDLSFIERALYAAKLEEARFDRETIMAALNVDKTGLSRLISAAVKVPRDLVEAVGPAPKVGRDRWIEFASLLDEPKALVAARGALGASGFTGADTDTRFELLLKAVKAPKPRARATGGQALTTRDGRAVGNLERTGRGARLVVTESAFAEFLARRLPDLYDAFGGEADTAVGEEASPSGTQPRGRGSRSRGGRQTVSEEDR